MNILPIPYLKSLSTKSSIESAAESMATLKMQSYPIDCINWPNEYPEKPIVEFKFAHIQDGLLIQFLVNEEVTRATYTADNQPAYRDSCVELFIDPFGDGSYYNFEFNAIGTLLLGFGPDRDNREKAPAEITPLVKRHSSLGTLPFEHLPVQQPWQLTVMIPFSAFWHHSLVSLQGKAVRGNLQKCGDDLPLPHYLTWSPIPTPHPDFHRPEYFGIFDFMQ